MTNPRTKRKIAMLIDGDNAQYKLAKPMIEEARRHGNITICRVYGDWSQPNMAGWKSITQQYAMKQIQVERNTTNKNATDIGLVIDAMDILHKGDVQGFCIVSSDSDFTSLCIRIRDEGLFIMGIGRSHTPHTFANVCDIFAYVENFSLDDGSTEGQLPMPEDMMQTLDVTQSHEISLSDLLWELDPIEEEPYQNIAPKNPFAEPLKTVVVQQPKPPRQLSNQQRVDLLNMIYGAFFDQQATAQGLHIQQLAESVGHIEPQFAPSNYGYDNLIEILETLSDKVQVNSNGYVTLKKDQSYLIYLLFQGFEKAESNGTAPLNKLGQALRELDESFSSQHYGYSTLKKLFLTFPNEFALKGSDVTLKQLHPQFASKKVRNSKALDLLRRAYQHVKSKNPQTVTLSAMGTALRELQPNFQYNQYGYSGLSKMIEAYPLYFVIKGNQVRMISK